MPFCPVCRVEYRQGFTHCVDCGELLAVTLESLPVPSDGQTEDNQPVLLCTISEDVTAGMIMTALQAEGIPAIMKSHGAGQYLTVYMGFSVFDKDIYVPAQYNLEALEVLRVFTGENGFIPAKDSDDESADSGSDDYYEQNRDGSGFDEYLESSRQAVRNRIIVIFFGIPLAMWLIFKLILFMNG